MPTKPLHPCRRPGCRRLTRSAYCDEHTPRDTRQSAAARGYDYKWQKASKAFLCQNPWCIECKKKNKRVPATLVDHIIPHKGNKQLFWDRSNWQGLCEPCHNIKTAREDGGFGNPVTSPHPNKV